MHRHDRRRQPRATPATLLGVVEKCSKRVNIALNRGPRVTILIPFTRNCGIDIVNGHILERLISLPEAMEKLLHIPATNADRMWRQAFLPSHMVCEFLDQVCVGATWGLYGAKTAKKTEPLASVRDESPPCPPVIGRVVSVRLRLTVNPQTCSRFDLC